MASACVNNIGMSPENFLDLAPATYPSYGWLSPRISFSRDDDSSKLAGAKLPPATTVPPPSEKPDLEAPSGDFEFRLEDPVAMLPADELFYDGKLMPLQLSSVKPPVNNEPTTSEIRSSDSPKSRRRPEISVTDPYLFSPKAPRCSSRWKELLGLRKLYHHHHNTNPKTESHKTTTSSTTTSNPKSLKHFLQRSSKSSNDASLSLPLLKDTDNESVSMSSRLSLSSSSSSGHEHDDLPRLSLDSEKPNPNPNPNPKSSLQRNNPPRMRMVKPRAISENNNIRVGRSPVRKEAQSGTVGSSSSRGVSVDSPRMNSSGKIVFQSLERSSSSPSSFNAGGPRFKHRGMERSYSANVRVTPVLNVPVCSLRGPYSSKSVSVFGFGQLFSSPQKRSETTGGNSRGHSHHHYHHSSNSKNRTDRTRLPPDQ